jgi:type IV pilus assembly protein PilM
MFERLNQPISFRRKPTDENAGPEVVAATQAPTAVSDATGKPKPRSLLARLNQPISLGSKSKKGVVASELETAPAPAMESAERVPTPSEPVISENASVSADVKRVVVVSESEPASSVETETPKPRSLLARLNQPISLGSKSRKGGVAAELESAPEKATATGSTEGVTAPGEPAMAESPSVPSHADPLVVASEPARTEDDGVVAVTESVSVDADEHPSPQEPVTADADRDASVSESGSVDAERVASEARAASGASVAAVSESVSADADDPLDATAPVGDASAVRAATPYLRAATPEPAGVDRGPEVPAPSFPAPLPAVATVSASPTPVGDAAPDPIAVSATDPAAVVPDGVTGKRGARLGRLNQPISLGRKTKVKVAAPTPLASTASTRERGSRLGRLNRPIPLGRKSSPGEPPSGAPRAAPRRAVHVPQRGRRMRNLVGLEIEPGQLVAARSHVNGKLVVERAVGAPLAPNIVRDGEVTDVEGLSSALSDLFDGSGLDRRVRIGIANQRIVMRQIDLPPILDPKELANAVRFQAQDEIPMPIESVVLDYHALGIVETEHGARLRVLLVAARRDMVDRVILAARQAGLRPEGVDLSAFGMIRALRPADLAETDQVLYLAIGGITNLAIASGSTCEFTRVIMTGIDTIVAEVAGRAGLPHPDARRLVSSISASIVGPRPVSESQAAEPTLPGRGESPGGASADHAEFARTALSDGVRRIAAEVRNSLDFHLGTNGDTPIARTVLTGPALDLEGFDQALGRELGMPLTRGEVALASPSASGHVPMSRLAVAAGLSVEEGPQ